MKTNIRILFLLTLASLLFISCRESINTPEDPIEEKPVIVSLKQIQNPVERVEWIPGNTYEIKWDITNNVNYIKIDLLKKFKKVHTIIATTENDGSYNWLIPTDFPGSHHYRINLTLTNNDYIAAHSVEFEIQENNSPPILE